MICFEKKKQVCFVCCFTFHEVKFKKESLVTKENTNRFLKTHLSMWSLRCFCNKKKETKETEPIQQKEITIFFCQIIQEIRNREKSVLVLTQ